MTEVDLRRHPERPEAWEALVCSSSASVGCERRVLARCYHAHRSERAAWRCGCRLRARLQARTQTIRHPALCGERTL